MKPSKKAKKSGNLENKKVPVSSRISTPKNTPPRLVFSSFAGDSRAISYSTTSLPSFSPTTLAAYSAVKNAHSKERFNQQGIFFKSSAYHLSAYELAEKQNLKVVPFTFLIPPRHHGKRLKEFTNVLQVHLKHNLKRAVEFTVTIEFEGKGKLNNPHVHGLILVNESEVKHLQRIFNALHRTKANRHYLFHDSTETRNKLFTTGGYETILGWSSYSLKSYPSTVLKGFSKIHSDNIFATSNINKLAHTHFSELVTNSQNRKLLREKKARFEPLMSETNVGENPATEGSITPSSKLKPKREPYNSSAFIKTSFTRTLSKAESIENAIEIAKQHLNKIRSYEPKKGDKSEMAKFNQIQVWLCSASHHADMPQHIYDIANSIAKSKIINPLCKTGTDWRQWNWNFIADICDNYPKSFRGATTYELELKPKYFAEIVADLKAALLEKI